MDPLAAGYSFGGDVGRGGGVSGVFVRFWWFLRRCLCFGAFTGGACTCGLGGTGAVVPCAATTPDELSIRTTPNRLSDFLNMLVPPRRIDCTLDARGGVKPPRGETERSARTICYTPMVTNPISLATRHALAELLGERDNDALRPADVG